MKVIFLDMDGVINHFDGFSKKEFVQLYMKNKFNEIIPTDWHPDNMKVFKQLLMFCEKYCIKIVISSSWRHIFPVSSFNECFKKHFKVTTDLVVDSIPDIEKLNRGVEIAEWLKRNTVEDFVIINDKDEMEIMYNLPKDHKYGFYKTNTTVGLTENMLSYIFSALLRREKPKVASIVVKDKQGRILMFERTKENRWKHFVPSSKKETDENIVDCAIRELKEEINLHVLSTSDLQMISEKDIFCEKYNDIPEGMIFRETLFVYRISEEQKRNIRNTEPEKHKHFEWLYPFEIINFPEKFSYGTWQSINELESKEF